MRISGVTTDESNPFGAEVEELVAAALYESGLLSPDVAINGREASAYLEAFRLKRRQYEEATRLGNLLVRRGVLTDDDLARALELQRNGETLRLGEALVKLEVCSEDDIRKNVEAQGMIRDSLADLDDFRRKIDSIKERLRLYL